MDTSIIPYNIARAYALMGNRSQAVEWLRKAADDGLPNYGVFARAVLREFGKTIRNSSL